MARSYRLGGLETETSGATKATGGSSDKNVYTALPVIPNTQVLTPSVPNIPDSAALHYPTLIEMPQVTPPQLDGGLSGSGYLYVGVVNTTKTTPFVPNDIYLMTSTAAEPVYAGTPTKALSRATVVNPPLNVTNPATTDFNSVLVLKFDVAAPVALFVNYTDLTTLYTSYTANLLCVGREWIQFRNYVIDPDGRTVTFTGLLRGRRGTVAVALPPNSSSQRWSTSVGAVAYAYEAGAFIRAAVPYASLIGSVVSIISKRDNTASRNWLTNTVALNLYGSLPWAPSSILRYIEMSGPVPFYARFQVIPCVKERLIFENTQGVMLRPPSSPGYANDPTARASGNFFLLRAPYDRALLISEATTKSYYGGTNPVSYPASAYIAAYSGYFSFNGYVVEIPAFALPSVVFWNANPALITPLYAVAYENPIYGTSSNGPTFVDDTYVTTVSFPQSIFGRLSVFDQTHYYDAPTVHNNHKGWPRGIQ